MVCKKAKEELKKELLKNKKIVEEEKYWNQLICPKCGSTNISTEHHQWVGVSVICRLCKAKAFIGR